MAAKLRKRKAAGKSAGDVFAALPDPALPATSEPYGSSSPAVGRHRRG